MSATETVETYPTGVPNYFSQAAQSESLEQFIAGFHYSPPLEEDEVTMTGAKPELDSTGKFEPATPISLSEEPTENPTKETEPLQAQAVTTETAPSAEDIAEQPPLVTVPPPFATKGIKEPPPERSHFLDFSAPAKEASPTTAATSIGGPSFLGLSDTPATPAYIGDESAPRQNHWRAWTALVILAIFAGLGALEWRAEKNQSNNGPIGIMRMQIERLQGKKAIITPPPSAEATEPAEPASTSQPSGSGPQMQVTPQKKPQPANNGGTTTAKPTNPGATSNQATPPAPKTQPATTANNLPGITLAGELKQQTPSANSPETNGTSAKAANSSSNSAPESPESKTEKPAKATAPGTEELEKAANASDAAAASAWLWKAVARGNPEAPIKLANMYIKGDGVPQSCDQALVLLRSAAAKENAPARSRLGSLYATGTCVPRNRVRAYQYMSQALEANPTAVWPRQFRAQLWTQMTPQERQQAQTVQ